MWAEKERFLLPLQTLTAISSSVPLLQEAPLDLPDRGCPSPYSVDWAFLGHSSPVPELLRSNGKLTPPCPTHTHGTTQHTYLGVAGGLGMVGAEAQEP